MAEKKLRENWGIKQDEDQTFTEKTLHATQGIFSGFIVKLTSKVSDCLKWFGIASTI